MVKNAIWELPYLDRLSEFHLWATGCLGLLFHYCRLFISLSTTLHQIRKVLCIPSFYEDKTFAWPARSDASSQAMLHPAQTKAFIHGRALPGLKQTHCLRLINIIWHYSKLTLKVRSLPLPALNKSAPCVYVILSLDTFIYKILRLVLLANHRFILT